MRVSLCYEFISSAERNKRERKRETSKRHVGDAHSVLITAILLPGRLSCYWGKIVSCSPIVGSPTWVWPLRNRDPPTKTCRPTYSVDYPRGWDIPVKWDGLLAGGLLSDFRQWQEIFFYLVHSIQTGSRVHTASYTMDKWSKAIPVACRVVRCEGSHIV
jgi:hypothetical protein